MYYENRVILCNLSPMREYREELLSVLTEGKKVQGTNINNDQCLQNSLQGRNINMDLSTNS